MYARVGIDANPMANGAPPAVRHHRAFGKRLAAIVGASVAGGYLIVSYVLLPLLWKRYEHRHPRLGGVPVVTQTADGIPGDPLNVELKGTKTELVKIMLAAKWHPADPLSLKSCLEIAEASVFNRPYEDAPVSNLYLFGRKEDLAFEQPVGDNPRHRHHVRFWQMDQSDGDARPTWIGSAIYDQHVGFSRDTGQITHVTAADVDAERNYLFKCLEQTGDLLEQYHVDDFHKIRQGKNGGGDPWHTDGKLYVGVLKREVQP
jgi:hypothetical protein